MMILPEMPMAILSAKRYLHQNKYDAKGEIL
jgi:hypothetical protein